MKHLAPILVILVATVGVSAQERPPGGEFGGRPAGQGTATSPAPPDTGHGPPPGGSNGTGTVTTAPGRPPLIPGGGLGFPFPVGYGLPTAGGGRGPHRGPPRGGSGGSKGGSRPRLPRRRPGALEGLGRITELNGRLPYADDRWENWWLFNQDSYLDVDRRYRARARVIEMNGDTFLGAPHLIDPPAPLANHRHWLRRRLIPLLEEQLQHSSAAIRAEAAIALGKVGNAEVIPLLVKASDDRSRLVRQLALLGLGHCDDPLAGTQLARVLRDRRRQASERMAAALGLALLGERAGLQGLVLAVNEPGRDRLLTAAALYAMGFIPGDASQLFLREVIEKRGEQGGLRAVATLALARHGAQADIPYLLRLVHDSETHVRRSAILGLASQVYTSPLWGRRNALLDLERKWKEKGTLSGAAQRRFQDHLASIEMRASLETRQLIRLKRRVVDVLQASARRDNDVVARYFAAIALGRIGGPRAQVALTALLQKSPRSSGLESFTALGLAVGGARSAAPEIRRHLVRKSTTPSARSALCISLGLLSDRESGPVLTDLALSRLSDLRPAAAIGAGLMNYSPAIASFRRQLKARGPSHLRPVFGLALGLLGDHGAIAGLHELIVHKASAETRIQAAQALATLRDVASVKALAQALETVDLKDVARAHVIRALGQAGEKRPLPALAALRRDWNYLLPFPRIHAALMR